MKLFCGKRNRITSVLVLVVLNSMMMKAPARAETINCTAITSLPITITSQGVYCLTGHLGTSITSGDAIRINANNVTIDMNGFKLGGLAAGTGTVAYGIYSYQRKNITIRNGTIRGFYRGILLSDISPYTTSQGHLIEDVRADQNRYIGIQVLGRGNIVRRNQIVNTGGQTGSSYGIWLQGSGARVLGNDIIGTAAPGSFQASGVRLISTSDIVVDGNRISDISSGTGTTHGIYIESSSDVLVRANDITSSQHGVLYNTSTGKYMDNLTSNVTTPFTGGTAVGTNN